LINEKILAKKLSAVIQSMTERKIDFAACTHSCGRNGIRPESIYRKYIPSTYSLSLSLRAGFLGMACSHARHPRQATPATQRETHARTHM